MSDDKAHLSPFPGMDPYLESHWGDVGTSLTVYARRTLRTRLPVGLRARIEEVESWPGPEAVRAMSGTYSDGFGSKTATGIAVRVTEPETLRSIRIIEGKSGGRVVTTIEFLSPANKSFPGADEFRSKQERLLAGGVNVVEVDLLRSGRYVLSAPADVLPEAYRSPYKASVVHADAPEKALAYRFPLRDPLPAIRIPLRPGEPQTILELQPLVDAAYRDGGYADTDYTRDPDPPLEPDDAAWADELLRAAGKR